MKKSLSKPIYLIVNADDYGYFPFISRGIADLAKAGKVTATGILANSADLATQLAWLDVVANLNLGVHLNLSYGRPLTLGLQERLSAWQGYFPGAYAMSLLILTGRLDIELLRKEWRAQIEACGERALHFLNSHEHLHMLPVLFKLTLDLAQEYQIPYVRMTRAEWSLPLGISGLVRNTLLQTMQTLNQSRIKIRTPLFLGLSQSGKLNIEYLAKIFSRLEPGETYELMCHPGYFDPSVTIAPKLLAYHHWESELALLKSAELQALYAKFGIILGYYQK